MSSYRAKPPKGARLSYGHRLGEGLVSAWLFDEGGGPKIYDSANRNNGTLTNFTATSGWSSGPFGDCLTFDGVDDYIDVPNHSTLGITAQITMSAWVRRLGASAGQYKTIISRWGNSNSYVFLYDDTGNQLQVRLSGLSTVTVSRSVSIEDSLWHHATVTYDGANITLYLDGLQLGAQTASTGSIINNNLSLRIGRDNTGFGTAYWNGQLDAIAIYNRALSASEVRQLYSDPFAAFRRRQTPVPVKGPLLVGGYYRVAAASTHTPGAQAGQTKGEL